MFREEIYPDNDIDYHLIQIIDEKKLQLEKIYDDKTLKKIYINEVLLRGSVLSKKKPKSKYRNLKRNLLNYLDCHLQIDSNTLSLKERMAIKQNFLSISNSVMESEGYKHQGIWIFSSLFGLLVDLALYFFDLSDFYLNAPLFFLYFLISGIYKEKKAKKNGKLLQT